MEFATDRLAVACQDDGVRLATLFGSAVSSPTPGDVDVAVLFDSYHIDRYLALQGSLCRALGTRRVDLVVLNRANAPLRLSALLELDYRAVYRAVTDELADFDEFARQVQGYLAGPGSGIP